MLFSIYYIPKTVSIVVYTLFNNTYELTVMILILEMSKLTPR